MPPRILYPLLPYRSLLEPFLVVSAIAVPCWVVYRVYRHRTRAQPLSFARELLLLVFVLYLSGLAGATLSPSHPSRQVVESMPRLDLRPSVTSLTCASLPGGSTARGFCVRNARGNLVLFIPLGILLPLVWRRLRFWKGIGIAFAISVGIELVQYFSREWGSYRTADINDVILNVLGAGLGLLLVSVLRWRLGTRPAVARA